MSRRLPAVVLLLALLGSRASGGPEEVKKELDAAEALLKAKDWAGALVAFDQVLVSDAQSLAALRGRVEALLGAGNKPDAMTALLAAVKLGEARRTLAVGDVVPLVAMRTRLSELDPAQAEVEAVLRKHADALASHAGKWMSKDPEASEEALLRALRFQPDHAAARDRLGRLQRARAGKVVSLFNGRDMLDWMFTEPVRWEVKDGAIQGDMLQTAMILRSNKRFDGDHAVSMEARLVQRSEQLPLRFGLQAAYEGDDAYVFFGVSGPHLLVTDVRSATKQELHEDLWSKGLTEMDPVLKVEDWHTYTLELEGSNLRAYVDGKLVATLGRPRGRDGGYIALGVQGSIVHMRKIEVTAK